MKEKKQLKEEEKLISIIKVCEILLEFRLQNLLQSRGVCLLNDSLKSQHQPPGEGIVHINDNGELVWPVMFLYPEYGQCDYIMAFNENSRCVCMRVCVKCFCLCLYMYIRCVCDCVYIAMCVRRQQCNSHYTLLISHSYLYSTQTLIKTHLTF